MASLSSVSNKKPFSPGITASGIAPAFAPTTGTPVANASSTIKRLRLHGRVDGQHVRCGDTPSGIPSSLT